MNAPTLQEAKAEVQYRREQLLAPRRRLFFGARIWPSGRIVVFEPKKS